MSRRNHSSEIEVNTSGSSSDNEEGVQGHLDQIVGLLNSLPDQYLALEYSPLPFVVQMIKSHSQPEIEARLDELREQCRAVDACMRVLVDLYYQGFNRSIRSYSDVLSDICAAQAHVRQQRSDFEVIRAALVSADADDRHHAGALNASDSAPARASSSAPPVAASAHNQETSAVSAVDLVKLNRQAQVDAAVADMLDRIHRARLALVAQPDNRLPETARRLADAEQILRAADLKAIASLQPLRDQVRVRVSALRRALVNTELACFLYAEPRLSAEDLREALDTLDAWPLAVAEMEARRSRALNAVIDEATAAGGSLDAVLGRAFPRLRRILAQHRALVPSSVQVVWQAVQSTLRQFLLLYLVDPEPVDSASLDEASRRAASDTTANVTPSTSVTSSASSTSTTTSSSSAVVPSKKIYNTDALIAERLLLSSRAKSSHFPSLSSSPSPTPSTGFVLFRFADAATASDVDAEAAAAATAFGAGADEPSARGRSTFSATPSLSVGPVNLPAVFQSVHSFAQECEDQFGTQDSSSSPAKRSRSSTNPSVLAHWLNDFADGAYTRYVRRAYAQRVRLAIANPNLAAAGQAVAEIASELRVAASRMPERFHSEFVATLHAAVGSFEAHYRQRVDDLVFRADGSSFVGRQLREPRRLALLRDDPLWTEVIALHSDARPSSNTSDIATVSTTHRNEPDAHVERRDRQLAADSLPLTTGNNRDFRHHAQSSSSSSSSAAAAAAASPPFSSSSSAAVVTKTSAFEQAELLLDEPLLNGSLRVAPRQLLERPALSLLSGLVGALRRLSGALLHGGGQEGDLLNAASLAERLFELAELCLLALRCELRLRVFSVLLNGVRQSKYHLSEEAAGAEPDEFVGTLTADLSALERLFTERLEAVDLRYLFSSIPRLVCAVLVRALGTIFRLSPGSGSSSSSLASGGGTTGSPSSVAGATRINRFGVLKMSRNLFALQQHFSTTPLFPPADGEFERVRRFYQLLLLSEKDLLDRVSHASVFSLEEFKLILAYHRPSSALSEHVEKLFHQN